MVRRTMVVFQLDLIDGTHTARPKILNDHVLLKDIVRGSIAIRTTIVHFDKIRINGRFTLLGVIHPPALLVVAVVVVVSRRCVRYCCGGVSRVVKTRRCFDKTKLVQVLCPFVSQQQ